MQGYPLSYGAVPMDVEGSNAINTVPHPEVQLLCPRCKAEVEGLQCSYCQFQMEIHNGIVRALPPERVAYYAKFIADYERIRAAEGRGSEGAEFYLSLPYKDTSGRNSHQWEIRSRSYEFLIKHLLKPLCGRGSILDLGAGNCWMSFRLALLGYGMVAVDLLTNENDGLGAAEHFHKHLPIPISRFQAEAAHLPFRDGQFDVIIFNASFHYAEDYEAVLSEALRCLKPGGRLIALGPNIRYTGNAYWDFCDHYIALTDLSLSELMRKCGFEIEYARAQFLPYTMVQGRRYPAWVLKAYLQLTPLWKVFGKQFLIVAQKPV